MPNPSRRNRAGLCTLAFLFFGLEPSQAEVVQGWTMDADPALEAGLESLDAAIRDDDYLRINAVVIIRDGKLAWERYYNGSDRDTTHNPRSVGKTFVMPVLGLAIDQGHIGSLDQTLGDFYSLEDYDNYSTKKAGVTLRQLVSMTSGFEGFDFVPESPGNEENMYPTPDWVRWTLNLPMAESRQPGQEWRYFTAGIVVVGDILNRQLPGGLEAYADKHLFKPLGIRNYQWQHTPQGVANTAGGIQLTPLGFAKFGELHLRDGRWNGKQVLPAGWAAQGMQATTATTIDGESYGWLWWNKNYRVGDSDWNTAYCSGNGGNKIFVFPEQSLVIVVTASAYGQRFMHSQVDDMMTRHILPAIDSLDD
ncbi:MAG: serine hydrolase [Woeseiaceae bacterium]|nr:serine hydrolase [Woeseiaceae bacterium]